MAEGGRGRDRDALFMASWDDSGPTLDNAAPQAATEGRSATTAERARRLLRQLLRQQPREDWSPLPKL
jgi:hypothetical protein